MPNEEFVTLNNRYKLIERIGAGGMSLVYKAQDLSLGRIVAIKMLHDSLTGDEAFLRRFRHEAHAVANLTHPNIVTVHDIGQDGNKHYIVLEFVDGLTLKDLIREQNDNGRPLPVDRALNLIIQTCAGIGYAHRAGLVHCDVKPHNILVTRDDRVKVADFGIARAISQASIHESRTWGTPQYFSPEQAAGESATPASDVYSIGVVMFELLSGRLPFEAETHTGVAIKHIRQEAPLITDFNPLVPPQLARVISKIMSKEPAGRYRTAGQLGRILTSYQQSSMAQTGPTTPVTIPISEQKTEVYTQAERTAAPRPQSAATEARPPQQKTTLRPESANIGIDTWAVGLGITALVALLGLIPLWYFVYRAWAG
jgi:serine/threonine-protein kinase